MSNQGKQQQQAALKKNTGRPPPPAPEKTKLPSYRQLTEENERLRSVVENLWACVKAGSVALKNAGREPYPMRSMGRWERLAFPESIFGSLVVVLVIAITILVYEAART